MLVTLMIILSHLSSKQLISVKKGRKKKRKTYVTLTSPLLHTHSHKDTDTDRHTDTDTQTRTHVPLFPKQTPNGKENYTKCSLSIVTRSVDESTRFLSFMNHISQCHAIGWQDTSISTYSQDTDNEPCVQCHRLTEYKHIYNQDTDNEPCVPCHRLTGYQHIYIQSRHK